MNETPIPPEGYRLLTDEEKKQPLPMDALAYLGEEWLPSRAAGRMAGKSDQRKITYATRLSETKQTPERCRRVMADSDGAHRCQLPSNHSEACVFPMGRLPVVPSPTAEQRIAELERKLADIEGPEPYSEEILERRDLVMRINVRDRRIAELERERDEAAALREWVQESVVVSMKFADGRVLTKADLLATKHFLPTTTENTKPQ